MKLFELKEEYVAPTAEIVDFENDYVMAVSFLANTSSPGLPGGGTMS